MEFGNLLVSRRSVRAYREGTEVDRDLITEIVREAQLAPSWKNSQTARCYVALSPEKRAAVLDCLPEFNQKSSANAAAFLVTTFVRGVSGFMDGVPVNEGGNLWGAYDLGLNNAYLILEAREKGFDTLIMGIRDTAKLRSLLGIPEEEEVMAVIALGKRAGEPAFRPRVEIERILKID